MGMLVCYFFFIQTPTMTIAMIMAIVAYRMYVSNGGKTILSGGAVGDGASVTPKAISAYDAK